MATYIELKQQAQALLDEAEIVRKQEITEVVQGIKAQMKEYGLTVADLGGLGLNGSAQSRQNEIHRPGQIPWPQWRTVGGRPGPKARMGSRHSG